MRDKKRRQDNEKAGRHVSTQEPGQTALSLISNLRKRFHENLCSSILGYRRTKEGVLTEVPTFADSGGKTSIRISQRLIEKIGIPVCGDPKTDQAAGTLFTAHTLDFVREAFGHMSHIRPGNWHYSSSQGALGIAQFDQYRHLAAIQQLIAGNREIKSALGGDYIIMPDIVIARWAVPDEEINRSELVIDPKAPIAKGTPLRASNYTSAHAILHASISCKWTMRSDRSQNTRTEALNLIRNRKGNLPHVVAVMFEPLPSRLSSLALGAGDLDCVYHGALYELIAAVKESDREEQLETLETLVEGRRLRDISDLPFDLAI